MRTLTLIFLLFSLPLLIMAQGHIPVFPDLDGDNLLAELRDEYSPSVVLDYSMARDTLFKNIDARNDTLYGIYTHHGVYLPPGEDPTQAAFKNGDSDGINTEHSWPRSKGAGMGNAESDMHHLFPTRTPVNSARASFPFSEIPDSETVTWFYKNQAQSNTPNEMIDRYSELGPQHFEPRESVKGDIARALFYFYTIYRNEADQADPDFFQNQREDLCAWHLADPVDEIEWDRTFAIASYQDGKSNPFILDCTLAHRSYCPDFNECDIVNASEYVQQTSLLISPNPAHNVVKVQIKSDHLQRVNLILYNSNGAKVEQIQKVNTTSIQLDVSHLCSGIYFLHLSGSQDKIKYHAVHKLVVLP